MQFGGSRYPGIRPPRSIVPKPRVHWGQRIKMPRIADAIPVILLKSAQCIKQPPIPNLLSFSFFPIWLYSPHFASHMDTYMDTKI